MERSALITLSAINGALYATVGYFTYLGILAPMIGVVRFWPSVVIPAVFTVAFGPLVGGLGAAIGIFISDMLIHGNALLSLTVGVPANFICFYLMGKLYEAEARLAMTSSLAIQCAPLVIIMALSYLSIISRRAAIVLEGACAASLALSTVIAKAFKEWRTYILAASASLMVGSFIVGFGVWLFSQCFVLPTGSHNLPLMAAVIWFIWTYATEIPFLIAFVPPIIWALRQAGWGHVR